MPSAVWPCKREGTARAADVLMSHIRYDEEIARLHRELEARGGPPLPAHLGGPPQHPGPSQPPPPSIGHGPRDLFGGIMANPGGPGGPGLAAPQDQLQQPPPAHQMPQPAPGPQSQGPSQLQQPSFPGYPQPSAVNGMQSVPSHRPFPRPSGDARRPGASLGHLSTGSASPFVLCHVEKGC